ncbi:MAG: hypothetical protein HAW67_07365, partial [Endozoicomonadaceae bacterium]|nr:hypothetical protein [Endozoicomonadaceae bacterium]
MKDIIAHRGFWYEESEQNTAVAFQRALSNGFGIETDLRDRDQNVVISHDMPNPDCMLLNDFLKLCASTKNITLALNIKSDGLQRKLSSTNIANPHFYFDMSVPDMLGYKKKHLVYYTRYSDIEQVPSLYEGAEGIWLDNFKDDSLDVQALQKFLIDGKKVVLVSPELH